MNHEVTVALDTWNEAVSDMGGEPGNPVLFIPAEGGGWIRLVPDGKGYRVGRLTDSQGNVLSVLNDGREVWAVGDHVKVRIEP